MTLCSSLNAYHRCMSWKMYLYSTLHSEESATWFNITQNMREYGFSLTRIFPDKDRIAEPVPIRENALKRKQVFLHILRSVNERRKKLFCLDIQLSHESAVCAALSSGYCKFSEYLVCVALLAYLFLVGVSFSYNCATWN